MTRDKLEEHFKHEHERAIALGIDNAEHIRHGQNWCKHLRIEMVSGGLLAQTTGLPIGSHAVSCQYAEGYSESLNLPWIVPEFVLDNCIGCPEHSPGNDTRWAEQVISDHNQKSLEQEREQQIRELQLKSLKEQLRELSIQAREASEIDEKAILSFLEQVFSDDESVQNDASELLSQSARIGADLFPDLALDILIEQSLSKEFASLCMPVCIELAGKRNDLAERLEILAVTAINRQLLPEEASQILLRLGDSVDYPLSSRVIRNLVELQQHYRSVGGWYGEVPSYPNNNELLKKSYDGDPDSVTSPIRDLLREDDKYVRINACGVIGLLQESRPEIAISLLPDLIASLDLYDDPYEDSADGRVRHRVAEAFAMYPEPVDEFLDGIIKRKRLPVQQEVASIYREVIWQSARHDKCSDSESKSIPVAVSVATSRCLSFVQDEGFEPDIRRGAAEILELVSSKCPRALLPHFELMLGYYAIISAEEEPPPPTPQIVLPSQEKVDQSGDELEDWRRLHEWRFYQRKMLDVLKNLVKHEPDASGELLVACYEDLKTDLNERFKSALITLLGELGKNYSFQPMVLPLLLNGLMNFDSQLLRATSVRAVDEMYRYSKSVPPKNVVDILLLHLRDSYVIVHKAVINLLRWKAHWLDQDQAEEAINLILAWVPSYQDDRYYFGDLCETIIRLASFHNSLRGPAIRIIARLAPTNERLVDEKIAEELIRHIDPTEPGAELVGIRIAICLSSYYDRLRDYSYHNGARAKMFDWLLRMPTHVYLRIRPTLLTSAKRLAENDAWESCQFACLFARHGDYSEEAIVLEVAANSLGEEKRYQELQEKLLALRSIAISNNYLKAGKLSEAQQELTDIVEIGK